MTEPASARQAVPATDAASVRSISNQVTLTWKAHLQFEAKAAGSPAIAIDGDGGTGPGPIDTLLSALAACATSDVVLILHKQHAPVDSLAVDVTATRVHGTPRRLEHVMLTWQLAGRSLDRVVVERAIELSITKYCSVRESLRPEITIEWRLDLNGETGPAHRA